MNVQLSRSHRLEGDVQVTGSKSESNRLLILQALFPQIEIRNLSNSDDTRVLQAALNSEEDVIDVHHAGTAMRFLTAYFASREGREVILTGSPRMQERPIKILVEALRHLGADISYLKNEGYPPLKIRGKTLLGKQVTVQANISSQYISALMLIGAGLPDGLKIALDGQVTSVPYINMTLRFLSDCGIQGSFEQNLIAIDPVEELSPVSVTVESDWSSASYFYSMVALGKEVQIRLSSFKPTSYQGDQSVVEIYRQLGVDTNFDGDTLTIHKAGDKKPRSVVVNLRDSPDLAQTLAVTCFGLGVTCSLTGLHTLRIKETDRLAALKTELEKLGGKVEVTEDALFLSPTPQIHSGITIDTYHDHRMALAFAPLALLVPLEIADADVVSKSFPGFWKDCESLGFSVKEVSEDY